MSTDQPGRGLADKWSAALMPTYPVPSLALVEGEGAVVTDDAGSRYLDLFGGIAVNALGHAHPAVVEAVTRQVNTLGHVSNFFASPPAAALAERLTALDGRPGRVFFTNSGTEANEAAFKLSRLTGRRHVVATVGGFHGRTMGSLALTGQPSKAEPFGPLPGEVTHVPYGDIGALAAAVTRDTAMVILEPIQGENGVVVPPPGYLAAAREITAEQGALLVLDEVQTGIGRLGHWYGHQAVTAGGTGGAPAASVDPDVVTLAKGLGGGLPIGACVAFGPAAELFEIGLHGTTFGGNPVCCAAALAVLDTIESEQLLSHVTDVGGRLRTGVEALGHGLVAEVRGAGLLLGIVLTAQVAGRVAAELQRAGFLVNPAQPDVLRLAPPLNLTVAQADSFLDALPGALDSALDTEALDSAAGLRPTTTGTGAAL